MTPKSHKLFYGSSYDRGLIVLLQMWPKIKAVYSDATLDIAYGWDLFVKGYNNNPERMRWRDKMVELMKQDGITEHGRIGKKELKDLRRSCGIWAYPTSFTEINCITALECQNDGLVPCVISLAALEETVQSGVKIAGEIFDPEVKASYLKSLLELMGDPDKCESEAKKGILFAQNYSWANIAELWQQNFHRA